MQENTGPVTRYFVQTFVKRKPDRPFECRSLDSALRYAARVSTEKPVLAFSIRGDADLGDYDPPKKLIQYGDVPEEALEALEAA